jgi:hypothetical protein
MTPPPSFFRRLCPVPGIVLILLLALFSACASNPGPANILPQTAAAGWDPPQKEIYSMGDHLGSEAGEEIPIWVSRYLERGIAGLEAMNEFAESYVFVAENSGTNINALAQWAQRFSPNQDIAQLVSRRVQARFPGADTGSPDREYGRYFESLVRAAADASYIGAEQGGDFWFLKKYPGGDGETPEEEIWVYLILVIIDKAALRNQLEPVLAKAAENVEAAREQTSAINQLRSSFFNGF